MSSLSASCHRCGGAIAQDLAGEGYCEACEKMIDREALRHWAAQWAASLSAPDQVEYFFTVLAAVWSQGFAKARVFTDALPTYEPEDNPFTDESGHRDPLRTTVRSPGSPRTVRE